MTERSGSSGSDPISDFQRWLMRSSAKTLGSQLKGQVRRTIGGNSSDRGDVWETATAEPLPDEAPECAWCPVCRAARKFRQSGPGLASQVAGAGDALLNVAQDTLAAFEATLSAQSGSAPSRPAPSSPPQPAPAPAQPGPAQPGPAQGASAGTGWPAETDVGSTGEAAGSAEGQRAAPDEPDHRP